MDMNNLPANVRLNSDAEMVAMIRKGLEKKGGYCPCRLQKTEDNICICKEFREQIADPDFEGYCHCRLYWKSRG
jgi:ferredoxin-thioredoxin reductase catalytic subunit